MFSRKKKKEGEGGTTEGASETSAQEKSNGKGKKGSGSLKGKEPMLAWAAVPMKGDLAVRPFRKPTKDSRKKKERDAFDARLVLISKGYKSKRTLLDLEVKRTVGTGSFGRVLLVTEKKTKPVQHWACKIISKDRVIKTHQLEHTINEKNVLFCTDNKFVVKMMDYFQDRMFLYFILEFINGGEMFTHIQKQKKRRFSEEQARFFSAETILAFEYLHNLDIIFRDLKPENLLIDFRGHIRVTDFGFAKRVDDKTWTMCGTPEYLAPEIIINKGYSHAVDWWAIGVLTYELRCGHSPFESRSQVEMFKRIAVADFKFPRDFTELEQSFISGLLQVDQTKRLGSMHGGVDDIKRHRFFDGINWDKLSSQDVKSPYIPEVTGPGDTSNFDQYPEEVNSWHGEGEDKFGETFIGF